MLCRSSELLAAANQISSSAAISGCRQRRIPFGTKHIQLRRPTGQVPGHRCCPCDNRPHEERRTLNDNILSAFVSDSGLKIVAGPGQEGTHSRSYSQVQKTRSIPLVFSCSMQHVWTFHDRYQRTSCFVCAESRMRLVHNFTAQLLESISIGTIDFMTRKVTSTLPISADLMALSRCCSTAGMLFVELRQNLLE